MSMYSLRGGTVQLRRRDCSVSAAGVFSLKRSGCTTPTEYALYELEQKEAFADGLSLGLQLGFECLGRNTEQRKDGAE